MKLKEVCSVMGKTVIRVIALLAVLLLLALCVPTSTPLVLAEGAPCAPTCGMEA